MLEIVGVKNLPEGQKGTLFVSFSKKQPDAFFTAKRRLSILSESKFKQVSTFQCEPTGDLVFELKSHMPSTLPISKPSKIIGFTSMSLDDFLTPLSQLCIEKWVELVPSHGILSSKPIYLRIAMSFTVPVEAPRVVHMVHSRPFSKSSCLFPLAKRFQYAKSWTRVFDETGTELISLQMRYAFCRNDKSDDCNNIHACTDEPYEVVILRHT